MGFYAASRTCDVQRKILLTLWSGFFGCGGGVWPAEPRTQRPRLRERISCTRDEPDTRPAAPHTHHWAVGAQSTHRTFVERCSQGGDGGDIQRTVQSGG